MLKSLSHVQLFETPWTVACQAPLSIDYSRQEYWSVLPFPPPGDLPDLRTEPAFPALAGRFFTNEPPWEAPVIILPLLINQLSNEQCSKIKGSEE